MGVSKRHIHASEIHTFEVFYYDHDFYYAACQSSNYIVESAIMVKSKGPKILKKVRPKIVYLRPLYQSQQDI